MKTILDRYLDRILLYANKSVAESESIRQELKDHLLQKIDDLVSHGMSKEEAGLEALRQHGAPKTIGYKLRGSFRWIDIRSQGTARGFIAIGPRAVGVFACGGFAMGIFAFGGFSLGLFSAGGFALGLLLAWGGFAAGGVVSAGMALGIVAVGGVAIGVIAEGGLAIASWVPHPVRNGDVISHYTSGNVPPFLRSLEPALQAASSCTNHFAIIMPVFMMMLIALNTLLYREGKRVQSENDWLLGD